MGYRFDVKIFNSSDKVIDFKIINSKCVYTPKEKIVKTSPGQWAVFKDVESSYNMLTVCHVSESVFQIAAIVDGQVIGSTKYRVYVENSSYCWYTTSLWDQFAGNTKVRGYCAFTSDDFFPNTNTLLFERVESYGDLFFTGRDIFVDNSASVKAWQIPETIVQEKKLEIEGFYPPSLLINSVKTLDADRNDTEFRSVVSNLAEVAALCIGLWGSVKPSSATPSVRSYSPGVSFTDDLKENWKQILSDCAKVMSDYYAAYTLIMQKEREITITISRTDSPPSFHAVFTDSLFNKAKITSGNFDMPPPPDNHDTFYESVRRKSPLKL
ncbi:hypothetical protein [Sphingomonas sanguinis]|uniref:hypothetical protein n=1 Tax=Sphingomonas sanguinis TaxID=33051 RepID=UPI000A9F1A77|nr:hypothetical protein [Sphingomonas sanguinis]